MGSNNQTTIPAETFGGITLINADCMEVLRELPDNAFDLAIVDPPYGINAPNMTMGSAPKKTKSGDGISVAQRLKKGRLNSGGGKLKNRALNSMPLTWDCERPSPEYFTELFRISRNQIIWGGNYYDLPPTRGVICWDKMQPWDNFSQWEMAWTSFDRTARLFRYSSRGGLMQRGKYIRHRNLWPFTPGYSPTLQNPETVSSTRILAVWALPSPRMTSVSN